MPKKITLTKLFLIVIVTVSFLNFQNYFKENLNNFDLSSFLNDTKEVVGNFTGLLNDQKENNFDYYYDDNNSEGHLIFPSPLNLDTDYHPKKIQMPYANNVSYIYFEDHQSSNKYYMYEQSYDLKFKLINNISFVEIIWNGNMHREFLKFKPGNTEGSYNFSLKKGNIKKGLNKYLIRGYGTGNKIYERIFYLDYIGSSKETHYLEKTDKKIQGNLTDNDGEGTYYLEKLSNGDFEYTVTYKYNFVGDQIIKLNSGKELIVSGKYIDGHINFKSYISDGTNISYGFNKLEGILGFIEKPNGDILFFDRSNYFLYKSSDNYIYDLYKDYIQYNDKKLAYSIYKVEFFDDKTFRIREHKYAFDDILNYNGHEIIVFDINTREILSRKNIENLGVKTNDLNDYKYKEIRGKALIISENFGYSININSHIYKLINTDVLNNYIKNMKNINAGAIDAKFKIYENGYIELLEVF